MKKVKSLIMISMLAIIFNISSVSANFYEVKQSDVLQLEVELDAEKELYGLVTFLSGEIIYDKNIYEEIDSSNINLGRGFAELIFEDGEFRVKQVDTENLSITIDFTVKGDAEKTQTVIEVGNILHYNSEVTESLENIEFDVSILEAEVVVEEVTTEVSMAKRILFYAVSLFTVLGVVLLIVAIVRKGNSIGAITVYTVTMAAISFTVHGSVYETDNTDNKGLFNKIGSSIHKIVDEVVSGNALKPKDEEIVVAEVESEILEDDEVEGDNKNEEVSSEELDDVEDGQNLTDDKLEGNDDLHVDNDDSNVEEDGVDGDTSEDNNLTDKDETVEPEQKPNVDENVQGNTGDDSDDKFVEDLTNLGLVAAATNVCYSKSETVRITISLVEHFSNVPKSVIINGNNVAVLEDDKEGYYIELEETEAGVKTYNITSVTLGIGSTHEVNASVSVEILKDKPVISGGSVKRTIKTSLDEETGEVVSTKSIISVTVKVTDYDSAAESMTVKIGDKTETITEKFNEKTFEFEIDGNDSYEAKVTIEANLCSEFSSNYNKETITKTVTVASVAEGEESTETNIADVEIENELLIMYSILRMATFGNMISFDLAGDSEVKVASEEEKVVASSGIVHTVENNMSYEENYVTTGVSTNTQKVEINTGDISSPKVENTNGNTANSGSVSANISANTSTSMNTNTSTNTDTNNNDNTNTSTSNKSLGEWSRQKEATGIYASGCVVTYRGVIYKQVSNTTSWWCEPGTNSSVWSKIGVDSSYVEVIEEWSRAKEATGAYIQGYKVTYKGSTYLQVSNSTSWWCEPGTDESVWKKI